MKNILLYDFLLSKGGAENVSIQLCNGFQGLDLIVGFVDSKNHPCVDNYRFDIKSLHSKHYHPVLQALFVTRAFESLTSELDEYKKAIFSGSYAPMAVKNREPGTENFMYCHTPPRFIYDLKNYYMDSLPVWQKPLFNMLISHVQPKYEAAITRMNLIIANSKNVQKRIKEHLDRESVVVYPPVATKKFKWIGQGDYYLSTARLESYKRIKLIIDAFKMMPDKKLVVASGGSQYKFLQKYTENDWNISLVGWTSNEDLVELIGNAIATLYIPVDEDFGISPIESMAAGKPVIGVDEGGVRETVIDGVTGIMLPASPSKEHLIAAVEKMKPTKALEMRLECEKQAENFNEQRFFREVGELINL